MANLGDSRRPGNREKFVPDSAWTLDDKASYLFVDLPGFKKEQLRLELAFTGHIIISGERAVNENKSIYFEQTFELPENSDTDKISGKFDGDFLHVTVPKRSEAEENKQQEMSSRNENHANSFGETSAEKGPNNHGENQSNKHEDEHDDHHEQQQRHGDEATTKGEMIRKEACRVASFPKEMLKRWEQEDGPLEMAMNFIKKNKGVVVSVVLAFSIGVLICRTFESGGK